MKLQDIELPCIGSVTKGETDQKGKSMSREETLVSTGMRLQIFWKSSAYFLEEETVPKSKQASFVFFFKKKILSSLCFALWKIFNLLVPGLYPCFRFYSILILLNMYIFINKNYFNLVDNMFFDILKRDSNRYHIRIDTMSE